MSEAVQEKPFWLSGNFAPTFEEVTETELSVTGSIPPELNGRYLRNGANPESGDTPHWFLGNGMIHGVELSNGGANWYRNRYVRTPLLSDADANPLDTMQDLSRSLANTHIISHAGKILALEEGHWPFELSKTLDTVGAHNYDEKLTTGMTAHPKICPETGELLFFAYGMVAPFLTYHRANAKGELVQSEQIEVKGATMVHDFNITRNHVIFMDLPLVWDMANAAANGLPIGWSDDYGARLGVMPRNGTNADIVWYDIDPCYVYHPLNAYEEGDDIIIDVCRMAHSMKPGAGEVPPVLHRWTIHQASGTVSESQLDDKAVEFPRVPDAVVGLKHRFGYTAEFGSGLPTAVAFRKYDLQTGESKAHDLGAGRLGGEPVFVPAQGASNEDDGYLMSFVYDAAENRSDLVIVDASTMSNEPVATVHLPNRVPAGFHGSWVAD
ncbi:MAG: carotenoid cleavage dioxygenase-like enzyme [Limisphaerales bacterium]|jgi:carotenoid cleavage dioxygenase-like enzyme